MIRVKITKRSWNSLWSIRRLLWPLRTVPLLIFLYSAWVATTSIVYLWDWVNQGSRHSNTWCYPITCEFFAKRFHVYSFDYSNDTTSIAFYCGVMADDVTTLSTCSLPVGFQVLDSIGPVPEWTISSECDATAACGRRYAMHLAPKIYPTSILEKRASQSVRQNDLAMQSCLQGDWDGTRQHHVCEPSENSSELFHVVWV